MYFFISCYCISSTDRRVFENQLVPVFCLISKILFLVLDIGFLFYLIESKFNREIAINNKHVPIYMLIAIKLK